MSAPTHTDLRAALDAEHAQRIALQHHAADQARRVADLEAEIERLRGLLSREQQERHAMLGRLDAALAALAQAREVLRRVECSYSGMLYGDDKATGPSEYTRGWGDCLTAIKTALAAKGE